MIDLIRKNKEAVIGVLAAIVTVSIFRHYADVRPRDQSLPPAKIIKCLDDDVIGLEHAKKELALAAFDHYNSLISSGKVHKQREAPQEGEGGELSMLGSNVLVIGGTGSGKSYLIEKLSTCLNVPVGTIDLSTCVTGSVRSCILSKKRDIENLIAGKGILIFDQMQVLWGNHQQTQQELLAAISSVDSDRLFLVASGTFNSLLPKINSHEVKPKDLLQLGVSTELLTHFPVLVPVPSPSVETLLRILVESPNSLVAQYERKFHENGVDLSFTTDALRAVAVLSLREEIGARGLPLVMKNLLKDAAAEVNYLKRTSLVITEEMVLAGDMALGLEHQEEQEHMESVAEEACRQDVPETEIPDAEESPEPTIEPEEEVAKLCDQPPCDHPDATTPVAAESEAAAPSGLAFKSGCFSLTMNISGLSETFYSPPFTAHGYNWRVRVGPVTQNTVKHLAFYLHLLSAVDGSASEFSVPAQVKLLLLSRRWWVSHKSLTLKQTFTSELPYWGSGSFIKWTQLKRYHMINDTVVLAAKIQVADDPSSATV